MVTLWIIIAVAIIAAVIIIYMTTREKNAEETPQVNQQQPQAHQIVGSAMNAVCHAAKDYDELLKSVKM